MEVFEHATTPVLASPLGRAWRVFATCLCFSVFGLGGLALGFLIFPGIHLVSLNRQSAQRRCRWCVGRAFRLFRWLMESVGVIAVRVERADRLKGLRGALVVANHPTLIDVVLILGEMDDSFCVVKRAAWSNPFMLGVMHATGYIANADGPELVAKCVEALEGGGNVMLFPEGTRTRPGAAMAFRRGFAIISLTSGCPMTPVFISVVPPMLRKFEPFYRVPPARARYELFVGEPVGAGDFAIAGGHGPSNARLLTDRMHAYFTQQIEHLWGSQG